MSTDAVTFILRASGWPEGVDPEHHAFDEERAVAAALEGRAVIDGQVVKVERGAFHMAGGLAWWNAGTGGNLLRIVDGES